MFDIFNKSGLDLGPLENLVQEFMPFAQERHGFKNPPSLFLLGDEENAANPLGKTGGYDPGSMEVTIYVSGRHPKDILRSLSHELVHHNQNERGDFSNAISTALGYAQDDPHMREMEREAYEQGNLCFRDWEDGRKKQLQESIYYETVIGGEDMSKKIPLKEWKDNEVHYRLMKKFGLLKEEGNDIVFQERDVVDEKQVAGASKDDDDDVLDEDEDPESINGLEESVNESLSRLSNEATQLLNEQWWRKGRGRPRPRAPWRRYHRRGPTVTRPKQATSRKLTPAKIDAQRVASLPAVGGTYVPRSEPPAAPAAKWLEGEEAWFGARPKPEMAEVKPKVAGERWGDPDFDFPIEELLYWGKTLPETLNLPPKPRWEAGNNYAPILDNSQKMSVEELINDYRMGEPHQQKWAAQQLNKLGKDLYGYYETRAMGGLPMGKYPRLWGGSAGALSAGALGGYLGSLVPGLGPIGGAALGALPGALPGAVLGWRGTSPVYDRSAGVITHWPRRLRPTKNKAIGLGTLLGAGGLGYLLWPDDDDDVIDFESGALDQEGKKVRIGTPAEKLVDDPTFSGGAGHLELHKKKKAPKRDDEGSYKGAPHIWEELYESLELDEDRYNALFEGIKEIWAKDSKE